MAKYKVTTRETDGKKLRGVVLPEPNMDALPWGADTPAAAYLAESELEEDGTVISTTIPTERFVPFSKPGLRVESDQLVTVKAMGPGGNLVQLPMENQINNHVASPSDHVGVKYYERKGFTIFFDFLTGVGVFCPTKNCWAEWNKKNTGYCTDVHKAITNPDTGPGKFGAGATTTDTNY